MSKESQTMNAKPYPVRAERVHVPMRDGVRLSAHIHRPDTAELVPAIVQATPYRKGPLADRRHHPIVEHGYATITFDIRGTGDSEGWNEAIYSATERQDSYDLIEWAASQPWCNGNVGMWGISFGAVAALQMAMMAPPHLKAIIAYSGTDDPYTDWACPGGSPRPYMYLNYAPIMTAANFSPPDPAEVGDRWAEIWAQRLERNVPWGIPFLQNLTRNAFWQERALRDHYDRVRCAVMVVCGWADWYHTPLLRTFAHLKGPKRALIGPWSHQYPDEGVPGPRIEWLREVLKWFDYWLKGVDTGVLQEPPVILFVREYSKPGTILLEDRGKFRCENEWPLARTRPTPLYLAPEGRLSRQPMEVTAGEHRDELIYDPRVGVSTGFHGGGPFNVNWAMPLDQRLDEIHSLVYTTEPLEEEVEVTGVPRAVLYLSSTAPITFLAVKLCDVAPDGTSALVTKGYLNVAHRESHATPSPIEPGRVYRLEVELLACAYRFQRGHRLRFSIASADFLNAWPTPDLCTNTLHCSAERPSSIVLPIVPPQDPELPKPDLALAAPSIASPGELEPPALSITRDIIRETQTVTYEVAYRPRWTNRASFTVSAREPALAVARGSSTCGYTYEGQEIEVQAECVTTSDRSAFHHIVLVNITVNGKPYWNKSWAVSVPRRFA
jgi:putative CocE/NonD family hydrolase